MSKHIRYVVLSVLLFSSLFFVTIPALAGTVCVSLNGSSVAVGSGSEGAARFEGESFQMPGVAGEPQLPYRVLKVLLPPEADLASVSVSLEEVTESEVGGLWDVKPVPPMATWDGDKSVVAWPEGRNIEDGRDVDIYGTDAFFPQERTLPARTGEIRGWKVVDVPVALFRYNPATRKLMRLEAADVVLDYSGSGSKSSFGGTADPIASDLVRDAVVNYDDMVSAYGETSGTKSQSGEELPCYVIITTQAIWEASDSKDEFVTHKESEGFDVEVVTEEEWGGGTGDEAAENLHSWLAGNYLALNAEYVLLIGNPNPTSGDVPMKMLWPMRNNSYYGDDYPESPSDLYYADLTGNWDLDGDGYYGEWDDDFGDGGVDTNWDVVVGRIPVYGSVADLDAILAKTIRYETAEPATAEWRRNVLLPMVPSDAYTPGCYLGEAIKDDVLARLPERTYCRVYDEDYGLELAPEYSPCSVENVTTAWTEEAFGVVAWWTHGNETIAWKTMDVDHVPSLDDDHPSIVFQCSCLNATPERSDNLSYSLLKNGAVVTIGATRVSWYSRGQTEYAGSATNSGMTYDFSKKLMLNGMASGAALAAIKQESYATSEYNWMNFTDFNLLGDPSLELDVPDSTPGSITVNIDGPDEARWLLNRMDSYVSGTSVSLVSGVVCDISFSDVDGWAKPNASTVTVASDGVTTLNVTYTKRTLDGPTFVKQGGGGDGSSWDSPKKLADALRNAMSGEEIWVAEGLYLPKYDGTNNFPLEGDERGVTFTLKSGVTIYGGFPDGLTGTASADRDPSLYRTVLTGDLDGDDETDGHGIVADSDGIAGSNAYNVIRAETVSGAVLEGLTVTAGQALGGGDSYGGGLYGANSTFRVSDCIFSGNASSEGGAMIVLYSQVALESCTFSGNRSTDEGGGAYSYYSTVSTDDCRFVGNRAEYCAGGVKNDNSEMTFDGCIFTDNSAGEYGGGMGLSGGSSVIRGCTFDGNANDNMGGGAIYAYLTDPTVENCTFSANRAPFGAALYCSNGTVGVTNCTFAANSAEEGGSTLSTFFGSARILNSVFWDDTTKEMTFSEASGSPVVSHCVVRGGLGDVSSTDNIITEDPCLGLLADNGGPTPTCTLLPGSSALDAGTSDGVASSDQRGVSRPQGAGIDIGACEIRPGALRVFLHGPDEAAWSLNGEGSYGNGHTLNGLQVGTYSVAFTSASGWRSPVSEDVTVTEGETVLAAADYGLAVSQPASWSHVEAGEAVTLEWEPFSVFDSPVEYEVYMEEDGTFVQVPADQVDGTSVTLDLNGHTTYTLRVDADGFEGEPWAFTTPNRAPRLIRRSPVNGSHRLPAETVLSWLYVDPDGDSVDYDLYEGSGEALSLVCSGDSTSFAPELSCDCLYGWQVVAKDRFEGMEAFEPGITSSDVWSFAVTSDVHRITPPVPDAVLVAGGVNDIWVATLDSADLDGLEAALGGSVVPAETVLSMDVEPLSDDLSPEDRRELLEGAGTFIADVLSEGFRFDVAVSDDVNLVPVPVTLSFTEEHVGRVLSETTLLDAVHIFAVVGGQAFDLVRLAGEDRDRLFSVTSDVDDSGVSYFVSFRLYLADRGSAVASAASDSGVSLFTDTVDAAFLVDDAIEGGTFRASVMEATVEASSGSGGGCGVGAFSPGLLMLLLPLGMLRRK